LDLFDQQSFVPLDTSFDYSCYENDKEKPAELEGIADALDIYQHLDKKSQYSGDLAFMNPDVGTPAHQALAGIFSSNFSIQIHLLSIVLYS
jgi:hypothetical protein